MNYLADVYNPAVNTLVGNVPNQRGGITILQTYIGNFLSIAFGIGTIILIIMLFLGSYAYITAGGDKEAVQKATRRMTTALVGIIILFSIYIIIRILGGLFGINILRFNIPGIG